MPRGFLLKSRARLGRKARPKYNKKTKNEIDKLEKMESRLEEVAEQIRNEIDDIERIEEVEMSKRREFSWIKGKITVLTLQDFVGAAIGAIFFVVTQEVWELSLRFSLYNIIAVILMSFLMAFLLVYLSRRRKVLSARVYKIALLRGVEIYAVSLVTAFIFVMIFGTGLTDIEILKQSIVISLPATVSAGTADLLFY